MLFLSLFIIFPPVIFLYSPVFVSLIMSLRVTALGGFGEVGRNCLAVDVDGTILLLDMGFHLERYLEVTEDDYLSKHHAKRRLFSAGAIPDIRLLRRRKKNIAAVICSHAHLDHVGALPFIASSLHCPIHSTPFTSSVIRSLLDDRHVPADVHSHPPGSSFSIGPITVEFIRVAHSTPHSSIIAIHTPRDGILLYANDYKQDLSPPFGISTDLSRLKELSGNVSALVLDSLYAPSDASSPGESLARQNLLDLKPSLSSSRAIVISTFSSHIHRLVSICDLADSLDREVVFLGRSLHRYISSAKDTGIVDLFSRGRVLKYRRQIDSFLSKLSNPERFLLVTTGHQGEPLAVLRRMADGSFDFQRDDTVIFSCKIIPVQTSVDNRRILESILSSKGVSILRDVHVSGHAFADDHRHLLSLLNPSILIPSHAEEHMERAMKSVASSVGIPDSRFKLLRVGQTLDLS